MHICNNMYSQICIIIENIHYCDPDSSPSSTFNSALGLWTLNSHSENWVWGYFRTESERNHIQKLTESQKEQKGFPIRIRTLSRVSSERSFRSKVKEICWVLLIKGIGKNDLGLEVYCSSVSTPNQWSISKVTNNTK